jgi:hypothetical protein
MPLVRPTTTPLPDEIFDLWAPRLGEAELKVLLYIARRTLGFRKNADAISLGQFLHGITTRDGRVLDHGCGVKNRTNLVRALQGLEAKGLIRATRMHSAAGMPAVTVFALWWEAEGEASQGGSTATVPPALPDRQEVVPQQHQGSAVTVPDPVLQQHQGSAAAAPTTNRGTTHSQQTSETTCARTREAACLTTDGPDDSGRAKFREAHAIWQAVLADLRGIMTEDNCARWLAPAAVEGLEGRVLRVRVPSALHAHWLGTRLRGRIDAALRRTGYGGIDVTFVVASAPVDREG